MNGNECLTLTGTPMLLSNQYNGEIKEMRQRVYTHMLTTRGWKYRAFLRYLRFFKYAAFAPWRGTFLESYYVLMRYLDDVTDGDVPLPESYGSEADYLEEKIRFAKDLKYPKDEADHMMLYCFELADQFNEDFTEETQDILSSLLFDARRRNTGTIFPAAELEHHFHRLDIKGTIRATLKVFDQDPNKYVLLEPLGMASRFQFDLEDLSTDIAAGYVNISKEDIERLKIHAHELQDVNSEGLIRWRREHARRGLELLEEHHRLLPEGNFSTLCRMTFPLVYELPARKTFLKTLNDTRIMVPILNDTR